MTSPDFPPWSAGDRDPPLAIQVLQPDGITPMDLTGFAVAFEMLLVNGTGTPIGTTGTAEVVGDPTLGFVQYAWGAGDLAMSGNYEAEFILTTGGLGQAYPPNKLRVTVRPRV